jgi:hypothetical protein
MIIKIFATLERVSDDRPYNTKIDEACRCTGEGCGARGWRGVASRAMTVTKTVLLLTSSEDDHNQSSLRSAHTGHHPVEEGASGEGRLWVACCGCVLWRWDG